MVVDPQSATIGKLANAMAGQVDFANRIRRQRREIDQGIPAVILGADIDIVDVAKNATASARGDGSHELPFRDRRVPELDVGRGILDKNSAPKRALHLIDMSADDGKRLFGHWQ